MVILGLALLLGLIVGVLRPAPPVVAAAAAVVMGMVHLALLATANMFTGREDLAPWEALLVATAHGVPFWTTAPSAAAAAWLASRLRCRLRAKDTTWSPDQPDRRTLQNAKAYAAWLDRRSQLKSEVRAL